VLTARDACCQSPQLRPLNLAPGVVFEEVEGEGILIHMKVDEVFSVNGTGVYILKAIARQISSSRIASEMTEVFQIDIDTAERDVQVFLNLLLERGIIEEAP